MEHHHRTRSPEKEARDRALKRWARILLIVSIVALIPYLASQLLPFMRSIEAHRKINLSSACYTVLRVMLVAMPIAVALPSKLYREYVEKVKLLSKILTVISFLFFAGMVADIMTYNVLGGYEDIGDDPIMIKMLWGGIGLEGIVFCFIQGVFYLLLSKNIKGHKKDVVLLLAGAYTAYILLPFAHMLIKGTEFFTEQWYVWFFKNVYLWISNAFLLAGLVVATRSRRVWSELIWK